MQSNLLRAFYCNNRQRKGRGHPIIISQAYIHTYSTRIDISAHHKAGLGFPGTVTICGSGQLSIDTQVYKERNYQILEPLLPLITQLYLSIPIPVSTTT